MRRRSLEDCTPLGLALVPREGRAGRRVALVQEGGGIRGAFGAGVQAGLAEAGLRHDAFDALYGSSAGALNLVYWVSGRTRIGTRVYLDELVRPASGSFFLYDSPLGMLGRMIRGRPALDLGAVDRAMTVAQPFDRAAVLGHPSPIRVPLTRSADLATDMLDLRSLSPEDLMPTLLAGATVPVLADPPSDSRAGHFDGAFAVPLPIAQAISDGLTDLVAILTLPRWCHPPPYEEWILRALAARRGVSSRVARAVQAGRLARRAALRVLRAPPEGVRVTVIAPEIRLSRSLEMRREWIHRLVEAGVESGRHAVELARAGVAA